MVRFETCANNGTERTPRELPERLKRCCVSHMADCGLRWIAALTGLEWVVDCTLGALQRKDPSRGASGARGRWREGLRGVTDL
eukprot:5993683-Alexandrium_andersonii.AAC.1